MEYLSIISCLKLDDPTAMENHRTEYCYKEKMRDYTDGRSGLLWHQELEERHSRSWHVAWNDEQALHMSSRGPIQTQRRTIQIWGNSQGSRNRSKRCWRRKMSSWPDISFNIDSNFSSRWDLWRKCQSNESLPPWFATIEWKQRNCRKRLLPPTTFIAVAIGWGCWHKRWSTETPSCLIEIDFIPFPWCPWNRRRIPIAAHYEVRIFETAVNRPLVLLSSSLLSIWLKTYDEQIMLNPTSIECRSRQWTNDPSSRGISSFELRTSNIDSMATRWIKENGSTMVHHWWATKSIKAD